MKVDEIFCSKTVFATLFHQRCPYWSDFGVVFKWGHTFFGNFLTATHIKAYVIIRMWHCCQKILDSPPTPTPITLKILRHLWTTLCFETKKTSLSQVSENTLNNQIIGKPPTIFRYTQFIYSRATNFRQKSISPWFRKASLCSHSSAPRRAPGASMRCRYPPPWAWAWTSSTSLSQRGSCGSGLHPWGYLWILRCTWRWRCPLALGGSTRCQVLTFPTK